MHIFTVVIQKKMKNSFVYNRQFSIISKMISANLEVLKILNVLAANHVDGL